MKFKASIFITLLMMFLLTACGTTLQPTPTIPPTIPFTLPSEPTVSSTTPTSSTPAVWSLYHNDQYEFTFEYPIAYDEASYKDSCGIQENSDGIHLGNRIDLLFLETNGLNLTQYADDLLQSRGWTLDSLKNLTINGSEAVTVEYRFGGTNRFGTFTLIEHNSRVFGLNFSAGSFCDIPEAKVSESEVYAHILETFQFTP